MSDNEMLRLVQEIHQRQKEVVIPQLEKVDEIDKSCQVLYTRVSVQESKLGEVEKRMNRIPKIVAVTLTGTSSVLGIAFYALKIFG